LRNKSIAIDGPAGVGKSSVAFEIAKNLGFIHVDTGAIYRALAIYILDRNIDFSNEKAVCASLHFLKIELKFKNLLQSLIINGKEVTKIRSENVSNAASLISAFPCVRSFLLPVQHKIAETRDVVMDGRDISTVILPDANVKIFLTASLQERAIRRFKQLRETCIDCNYNEILSSIEKRDKFDSTRKCAPLRISKDSIVYDTTGKSFENVVEYLLNEVRKVL